MFRPPLALMLLCLLWLPFGAQGGSSVPTLTSATEPTIVKVRGRVVVVEVPAGFAGVKLQAYTSPAKGKAAPGKKPAPPQWRTVASKLMNSAAGKARFTLPRLTPRRHLRVYGERPVALPGSLLSGVTSFAADVNLTNDTSGTEKYGTPGAGGVAVDLTGGANSPSAGRTVSESDIWKIDGDRLYFFNSLRGLQVFDIANPDSPALLGKLPLAGAGEQMYLLDANHVVLLKEAGGSSWWWWTDWDYRWDSGFPPIYLAASAQMRLQASEGDVKSAGALAQFNAQGQSEHAAVVVEIQNGKPTVLGEVAYRGYLQESRLVGNVLYVASNVYGDFADGATDTWGCQITSIDLANPAAPVKRGEAFIPAYSSAVYATDRYFYAACDDYENDGAFIKLLDISDPTGILKEAGQVAVPGRIADKFKMNEDGNVLTAVSSRWVEEEDGWSTENTVSTFSLADPAKPVALGSLHVAAGEDLYATRFDGKRLYVVTALQERFDPLFIVDLTDPANLAVRGSVEVPGYSTFIQPLGDRLVTTGIVSGRPTVSLYDVSKASAPKQISSVSIGAAGSWFSSEANWDEKAFNVLPDEQLILLPVSGYEEESGYSSGVQIIDLLADKVVKRGLIKGGFYPRRAAVQKNRILSLAGTRLVAVNAQDRDHPVMTASVSIAWPVDRTFLLGQYLIEITNGNDWSAETPSVMVTPAGQPDDVTDELALSGTSVLGASVRDGVLYLLQRTKGSDGKGSGSRLSAVDVAHLPKLKLLGESTVGDEIQSYADVAPLWVNERTLIFTAQSGRSWFWGGVIDTVENDARTTAKTLTMLNQMLVPRGFYSWGRTVELIAYDVVAPAQPKLASRISLGGKEAWDVSPPQAFNDAVYVGFKSLPRYSKPLDDTGFADDEDTGANVESDANRYYLKLIDYSDATAPVVAEGKVNLPGELRGISRGGKLLYTVGPELNPVDGSLAGKGIALHVSGFDGAAAHLVDQLRLNDSWQPLVFTGETLLLLDPQPAQLWETSDKFGYGQLVDNPKLSILTSYTVDDVAAKFALQGTLTLEHEQAISQVGTLTVLRANNRHLRLLDARDPVKLLDLGVTQLQGTGGGSLKNAAGDVERGLWLPLGDYGVEIVTLSGGI